MTQIHYKTAFEGITPEGLEKWINFNKTRLIGSAIFTKNKSITSKIVRWAESWTCKDKHFIPSHVGSIILYNNNVYIFDMKPLHARVQKLSDYILNTDEDFVLVMRNFVLDTKMFSLNIAEHIGEFYPFMSAIRSVLTKRQSKWRRHCSELHFRELQKQGLFKTINAEITPDELLHVLKDQQGKRYASL